MNFFTALRDWLLDDVLWKVISLVLAIGIWLTVHRILVGGQAASSGENLPVVTEREFDNLPVLVVARAADVHNYRVNPDTVSVTVSGSPEVISELQAESIRAAVDLTDIEKATDAMKQVDIAMPPGITLVAVNPPRVSVISPTVPH